MPTLLAGQAFPKTNVPALAGGTLTLGTPRGGHDWQLVVLYRGLHCPLCKKYLARLEELQGTYAELGVDVIAVSGDPEDKAQAMVDEIGLTVAMGYGLTVAQMEALGLFISDPRSPQETDRPFPEPGLFVINDAGNIQILDISNAPFARPDLESIANGIKFIRGNDYPVRGMHRAA
ncbi:MAG: redoxin domain-containing protein [Pseudomonadota bacterium]